MAQFSKEIPLNPDSSLGPVTIGSKITVERGSAPLPLEKGVVELTPGGGWDATTVRITDRMDPGGTRLNIMVEIPDGIPLSHYVNVILKRVPVRLKVTLFPKIGIPGMGIPVSVSAAPITDDVVVTLPEIPQPAIELDAKFVERLQDGTSRIRATATLQLPPYIDSADRESALQMLSLVAVDGKNARVSSGELVPVPDGKSCILDVIPTDPGEPGRVTIVSDVSLSGLRIYAESVISCEAGRTFILNIDPIVLEVTRKKPRSFSVQVLEELPDGRKVLVPDASIWIKGDTGLIAVSPLDGRGRLSCTVTQHRVASIKTVDLNVTAMVDQDSVFSRKVTVHPEAREGRTLQVVFRPPQKTSVNPFIKGDRVVVAASLVSRDGTPIDDAEITFASATPGGWLAGPHEYKVSEYPPDPLTTPAGGSHALPLDSPEIADAVRNREAGTTVMFSGQNPNPGMMQDPPGSEAIIVRATLNGQLADEKKIPILLLPRPSLIADRDTISLLANARYERKDRPKAITTADVRLSVLHPGDRQWTISVDIADKKLLRVREKEVTSSSRVFEFETGESVPNKPDHPGPEPWIQTVTVKTSAVLDGLSLEGPTLSFSLCFEGIYLESIFEFDRDENEYEVTDKKAITYQVLDPSEERALQPINILKTVLPFPSAIFAVMEWNGTSLVRNEHLPIEVQKDERYQVAQRSRDPDRKARHTWDFIFFTLKESVIEVMHEGMSDRNTGKYRVIILKHIPGNGERASGFIRFIVSPPDYYFFADHDATKHWQYELPIHLVLGTPPDPLVPGKIGTGSARSMLQEGARCRKIIDECFPPAHREDLWRELEAIPCKGPDDYRCFSQEILKRAHDIWAREQEDYLVAEKRWTDLIDYAEKAEFAGDIAFGALVMFYTAGLGPFANFAVSNLVSTIQSESKAVYSYYVLQGKGRDFPTCIQDYVAENWARFLTDLASGEIVEPYLQQHFEIQKLVAEPRKYGKMLTWLWLWKFQLHIARGIGKEDGGIINSAYKATTDIGMFLLTVTLAEVIKSHGETKLENVRLRDLYNKARKKGYFGGTDTGPVRQEGPPRDGQEGIPQPARDGPDRAHQDGDQAKHGGNRNTDELATYGDGSGKPIADASFVNAGKEPDLGGISDFHRQSIEKVAAEMGVIPIMRPFGDQYGHIQRGEAYPKITMIHQKTINPIDSQYLGFGRSGADKGLAACKKMPETLARPDGLTDAEWKKVTDRYEQRKKEYDAFADHLRDLERQGKIEWNPDTGLITHKGKGFAGDNDPFAYLDAKTGKPLTPEQNKRFSDRLHQVGVTQHPDHISWDYSGPHEHNANTVIDDAILKGHSQGGTPLNRYDPATGKWDTVYWDGGLRK